MNKLQNYLCIILVALCLIVALIAYQYLSRPYDNIFGRWQLVEVQFPNGETQEYEKEGIKTFTFYPDNHLLIHHRLHLLDGQPIDDILRNQYQTHIMLHYTVEGMQLRLHRRAPVISLNQLHNALDSSQFSRPLNNESRQADTIDFNVSFENNYLILTEQREDGPFIRRFKPARPETTNALAGYWASFEPDSDFPYISMRLDGLGEATLRVGEANDEFKQERRYYHQERDHIALYAQSYYAGQLREPDEDGCYAVKQAKSIMFICTGQIERELKPMPF
ncbi:hypothetical protein [Vibrio sp. WXL210]|uniref:hypothetical protein n=1 Tax=Vibrio sp. WXL210 TaxID=3450709 RepID=UPI003EC602C7